jgi:hypothetical protein
MRIPFCSRWSDHPLKRSREMSDSLVRERRKGVFSLEAAGLIIAFILDPIAPVRDGGAGSESNPEEITFRVHRGHVPDVRKNKKVFDSGSGWSLTRGGHRHFLQDDTWQPGSSPGIFIAINQDLRGGDVYLKNPSDDERIYSELLGYPLNQILMIILLAFRKGMIFHACGINDGGRGYLFLGNSTNGKSTLAKIWHEQGATVLNDDRIIVRERNGAFWMYGTPWHGTFDKTALEALPVEKIFFLKHGTENRLFPKTGSDAVSMILTRSFPPFWDRQAMECVLGFLERLTNALPCRELHFIPDERVIKDIRCLES